MLSRYTIAFIDFDKTIYDLQIPDYAEKRDSLAKKIYAKFNIKTELYPILEDTEKISKTDNAIKKYIYDSIDRIERNATGYFYNYTEKLLKKLSSTMPVVIVSNNSSKVIEKLLWKNCLQKYITYVYGRGSGDFYKPMSEVLEFCCKQVSFTPAMANNFMYAGNSWRDYQCASNFASKNFLNYTFIHPKMLNSCHF